MSTQNLELVPDPQSTLEATRPKLGRSAATLAQYFDVIGLEELLAFERGARPPERSRTTLSFSESLERRWP